MSAGARPALGATRAAGPGTTPEDRPVIKQPVWKPEIPAYLYTGGLAGASAALALLTGLTGEEAVARRAWAVALGGSVVSPVLLISDLGVRRRFLYMLRLFKVTSPMSVGSWILSGFGAATAGAAAHAFTGGRLGRPGRAAQVASGALGLPLAAYTGALLSATSIPAWHAARRELPFVFVAGAAMSAGAAGVILGPVEEVQAPRRLALGGAAASVGLVELMERRLDAAGVGGAYHEPAVRRLGLIARGLIATGAALLAARGRRSRPAAAVAGGLLTAGAIAERWAVFRAGFASAARPQDTIEPQRARAGWPAPSD
jgi:hypothetical protein